MLRNYLNTPVSGASLAVFRMLFGAIMAFGAVRVLASGWVEILFEEPRFFFKYPGFSWVQPWPGVGMYFHYAIMAMAALCVALGLFFRVSVVLFGVMFAHVQLIDATNYLNHYYLVCLVCFLMAFLPMAHCLSFDSWRKHRRRKSIENKGTAPDAHSLFAAPLLRKAVSEAPVLRWHLYLLRFQFAVVYVFAGLAKLNSDWLLHAQPLAIWMANRDETPLIGAFLDETWVAFVMSWFAFAYDCTIPFWLGWRRTRPFAFAAVLTFHYFTWLFFDIGLFPFLMTAGATLFFSPRWPISACRQLQMRWRRARSRRAHKSPAKAVSQARSAEAAESSSTINPSTTAGPLPNGGLPNGGLRLNRYGLGLLGAYAAVQLLVPLRHYAYPGNVLWTEEGMRFSWKVLVREKNGSITYFVEDPDTHRRWQVSPHQYLSWRQVSEMSGQPQMIMQLARYIDSEFRKRGVRDAVVRAEAHVSLNGRPNAPLIDPQADLSLAQWDLLPAAWITPEPDTLPIRTQP